MFSVFQTRKLIKVILLPTVTLFRILIKLLVTDKSVDKALEKNCILRIF